MFDSGGQDVTTTHQHLVQLKALPTIYRGVLYRSRLEARYAVFFDYLGIVFDYEPQGFVTDDEPYLPDFLLAGQSIIAEVKPSFDADPAGVEKWKALVRARGKERGVLLTAMHAGQMPLLLIGPDRGELWESDHATWLTCPNGYHYDVQPYPQIGCAECPHDGDYWYYGGNIEEAFAFARSYRFDRR